MLVGTGAHLTQLSYSVEVGADGAVGRASQPRHRDLVVQVAVLIQREPGVPPGPTAHRGGHQLPCQHHGHLCAQTGAMGGGGQGGSPTAPIATPGAPRVPV